MHQPEQVTHTMINLRDRLSLYLGWFDDDHHRRAVLIGLLVVAFVLRLTAVLILPIDYRFRADAVEYVSVANNLLAYGVFGEEAGVPYAVIPPGYPLFIAGVFALIGRSLLAVQLAQVVLGVGIVWLTYLAGKSAFSARVGLGAALICALYPAFIIYVVPYLTETLYTILALFFLLYFARSFKEPSVKHTLLAGVGFGLSILTREVLIAFPLALPILFGWARLSLRQTLRYLVVFAIVVLLVISPWLARNYWTFGQVFYTERTDAIRYQLTGDGYLSPRYEHLAAGNTIPPSESPELAEYYQKYGRESDLRSISYAINNPGTYIRYIFMQLVEFWLHPSGLLSLPNIFVVRAGYITVHVGMLGLALWQMVANLRQRDAVTGGLVVMLLYVTAVGVFVMRTNPRYNLPFLPIVFIFTARGALMLLGRFTSRKPAPA